MTDTGGDPACWADRVCPACGMLDERAAGARDDTCPHCDESRDDDAAAPAPSAGGPAPTGDASARTAPPAGPGGAPPDARLPDMPRPAPSRSG